MIKAAGRRIGRAYLRHGDGKDERNEAAKRPADADCGPTRTRRRLRQRVDAAGENADDGERDREVRELAHSPLKLLGIAHRMQDLHVLLFVEITVV
ncbi:hypothetical protein D3C72_2134110 [compost metagenome]